jgi:hypothetical protein
MLPVRNHFGIVVERAPRNNVTVFAGDNVNGKSIVHSGDVMQGVGCLSAQPQVPFNVETQVGLALANESHQFQRTDRCRADIVRSGERRKSRVSRATASAGSSRTIRARSRSARKFQISLPLGAVLTD